MWEAIGHIFTSPNGGVVGLLIIFAMAMIGLTVRFGHLRIKGDRLMITSDSREKERTVIRTQKDWLFDAIQAEERQVPKFKGYNTYRGKYIMMLVYKEMVDWVLYNHIEETKYYVESKQKKVWNIIQTNVEREELQTEEFQRDIEAMVKEIIHELVKIRKIY